MIFKTEAQISKLKIQNKFKKLNLIPKAFGTKLSTDNNNSFLCSSTIRHYLFGFFVLIILPLKIHTDKF